jgi:glutamate synthase domain-containing protein 3
MALVELEPVAAPEDADRLRGLIRNHRRYTASPVAARMLDDWAAHQNDFVKVMPVDYKRALAAMVNEKRGSPRPGVSENR